MTAPYYLYRIRTPDGCSYIGVSWDHKRRFTEHCSEDSLVGLAIRYFGPDNCVPFVNSKISFPMGTIARKVGDGSL